ncbi:MAG: transporter, fusion protein [Clostridia bacterium]|jgi:TRAP transporter 4TM/12TM fusion protein|nr:transporter, fusion protein [Clostridia bacterium]
MDKNKILKEQVQELDLDEIIAKYDKESNFRKLSGFAMKFITALAIMFSLFQLYTAIFGVLPAQLQRSIHLTFAFVLTYLMYPSSKKMPKNKMHWIDITLAVISGLVGLYIAFNYNGLLMRAGDQTPMDIFVAILAVLFVLEAARRVVGLPIVIIASVFLLYAKFGAYMPGFFNHRGYSVERIVSHMYYTTEGILGTPIAVSATFIFLFILFGAFLDKTGIGKFFIDLANAIAGKAVGGPAKVAVLSSALTGTISGSSVANTVGTGSFTIPLMKSLGYKPEFAGAVEAAASTGGQIMPPIMGAAAFLMAEFIGVPYSSIAKAAVIPALLYFTGIWIMVDLEARKTGMKGLDGSKLPKLAKVLGERWFLLLPIVVIVYMLMSGTTPIKAALFGILSAVIVGMIRKETRMNLKTFLEALEMGAKGALGVAIACACAGIIVGTVTLTGLGLKMGNGLVALAGGMLLPTLFLTMISSLILGMGAPTTANYIITSTIAAPALLKLGVNPLTAHMFVFYFGIIADITPPVALAAFAGSAIAKSDPIKTGINASKLAIAAFLIPYMFVINPQLLLIDTTGLEIVQITITSLIGMFGIGIAMEGYILGKVNGILRIIFLLGGLALIDPGLYTDVIGIAIIGFGIFYQWFKYKRPATHQA